MDRLIHSDNVATATKKRSYHHGDLRQALLAATVDLIAAEDIAAVSLRAIARRVGVTPAAPYHHFKDKNDLLAAVGREGFGRLRAELDRASADAGEDPRSRMRAIGIGYVGFAVANPAHYRVMFGCARKDEDEFPQLHAAGQSCFDRLIAAAVAMLGDKATESEVRRVAVTCWSACHGLATLYNDGPLGTKFEGVGLEVLLNQMLEMLLSGIEASANGA